MNDDQKKDIPASGLGGTGQPSPTSVSTGQAERKIPVAFQEPGPKPSAEITPTGEQQEIPVSPELTAIGVEPTPPSQIPSIPGIQLTGPLTPVSTEPSSSITINTSVQPGGANESKTFLASLLEKIRKAVPFTPWGKKNPEPEPA